MSIQQLLVLVPALMLAIVRPGLATDDEHKVEIESEVDKSGHNYIWNVTNRSNSPIVRIEFPHYAADLFHKPPGWKQLSSEEMNLVRKGWDGAPGVLVAMREADRPGLRKHRSASFGARIAQRGALRAEGQVKVVFEDGTETLVQEVMLPSMPAQERPEHKHMALIGTVAIFVLWVVFREIRRRRRAQREPAGEQPPATDAN